MQFAVNLMMSRVEKGNDTRSSSEQILLIARPKANLVLGKWLTRIASIYGEEPAKFCALNFKSFQIVNSVQIG